MTLFWQQIGNGRQDIILLHGWGLNAEVWRSIEKGCSSYFRLHFVDLPGYGRSNFLPVMSLEQMTEIIWQKAPKKAIWLGWSLGGLIASIIALNHQTEIAGLITVASSPCFIQEKNWPGINYMTFIDFKQQLQFNFHYTIERFFLLQTLNTKTAYKDMKLLKSLVMKYSLPSIELLNTGLEILQKTDLRQSLLSFKKPFLRIYGDLDNLIPKKNISIIDRLLPNSSSVIIKYAAHIPFISHPDLFIKLLVNFTKNALDNYQN